MFARLCGGHWLRRLRAGAWPQESPPAYSLSPKRPLNPKRSCPIQMCLAHHQTIHRIYAKESSPSPFCRESCFPPPMAKQCAHRSSRSRQTDRGLSPALAATQGRFSMHCERSHRPAVRNRSTPAECNKGKFRNRQRDPLARAPGELPNRP